MKLGLLTLLWQRPRLTELVLRYYAALKVEGVEWARVAVRSPEDPKRAEDVPGWHYVEQPNDTLSEKWEAGLRALREEDIDALLIIGSDDLVSADYVEGVAAMIREGSRYVMPKSLYAYSTNENALCYVECERVGAGRMLSRDLLEEAEWQLWDHARRKGTDGAMDRRLSRLGFDPRTKANIDTVQGREFSLLDVKSGTNLWPYEHLARRLGTPIKPAQEWLRDRFPGVADDLLEMGREVPA